MTSACCVALALLANQPLTIGSPAPKLVPAATLRGEPFTGLPKGRITVVEFSGTQCAPCTRCIPLLNALQAKHNEVVFVSVFTEGEPAVSKYLAGHGKEIDIRVVLGNKAVWSAWMRAAGIDGIPTVFVVGTNGKLAWIGSPFDLAEPLGQIVAGKYDARLDLVRLRFKQIDNAESRRMSDRLQSNNAVIRKIYGLLGDKRWSEAAAAASEGAAEYPEEAPRYRTFVVQALAAQKGRTAEALDSATLLSTSLQRSWADGSPEFGGFQAQIAQALLDGYGTNPDDRLLVVADILVHHSRDFLDSRPNRYPNESIAGTKWYIAKTAVNVAVAQKDYATAAARQREVIEYAGTSKYKDDPFETRERFDARQREYRAPREAKLAEYEAAKAK